MKKPNLSSPAMNATPTLSWLAYGATLALCHGWQAKPAGETVYGIGETQERALANGRLNLSRWPAFNLDSGAVARGLDYLDDSEAYQDDSEAPGVAWTFNGERVA